MSSAGSSSGDAIADRCGFEHPQYMAESSKKHFGITPGAYRTGGRKG